MATAIPTNYGAWDAPPTIVAPGTRATPPTPNWGSTFAADLGNLATRPEYAMAVREEVFNSYAWLRSGIIRREPRIDAAQRGPRVEIPLIKPFVPVSETVKSTSDWGANGKGYLSIQKINASQFVVPISHRAFAAGADELSEVITGIDPMGEIQAYLAAGVQRLETERLKSLLDGCFGSGGPLEPSIVDVTRTGAGTSTESNFLSASVVMQGKNKLGERGNAITILAMHSAVAYYLSTVGMLTFSTDALATGGNVQWGGGGVGVTATDVQAFGGFRVIIDDMLEPTIDATNGDKYPVYGFAPGVVAQGIQRGFRIRYGENILSFQDVLAADWHGAMAIMGVNWASAGDNPEDSDLATAANWTLAYDTPKLVPIVKMLVNTPFAVNP